jgi:hypothetical protein
MSRASRDSYRRVVVSVVPPCSARTAVTSASPVYQASSNDSVLTIRSGATTSR